MASLDGACPCATVIAASAIIVNGNAAFIAISFISPISKNIEDKGYLTLGRGTSWTMVPASALGH
jgi:hypothetical protein